ncbi:TRAP transporter substrate-binding protein DctP [Anianabacter salinae]|uniref:TRAP transporter substrate-binding protein DctP n=1 Tax=Anianabacter salinae TaxID=2851023 RepID=UPI00225DEA56|nr:TRAP transporter substrate-binding protein DctP [Anianabacter salinae]MBV0912063.1 TRAP transporter substrate-binding protein DctP [Anianabacter salinae]
MRSTTSTLALFMGLTLAGAASAQDTVTLLYSDTVPASDIRSELLASEFGGCLGDGFEFEPHHGATLFEQGTELTAMQRGNLDMGNLAIFDFYNQVPATSVLGTPFLFRDYEHMRAVYDGDVLDALEQEIEDAAGVKVLAWPYIGARHIGYVGEERIMTPEDLNGVQLRMPPGEGWQFVGEAMGATPVPVPFTEVYTALQTGQIDGQDNGFPATRSMKFDEVLTHIGTTSHLMASNLFTISLETWNGMTEDQQAKTLECADRFQDAVDAETLSLEQSLSEDMAANGVDVYMPDLAAFQEHVLAVYRDSKYSADWPEGLVEQIQAVGN